MVEKEDILHTLSYLRNKVVSSLGKPLGDENHNEVCNGIWDSNHVCRRELVIQYWSPDHLLLIEPMLIQINKLEQQMVELSNDNAEQ